MLYSTDTYRVYPSVSIFGALCVLLEVVGENLSPKSNKKLSLERGDFQVTILPTQVIQADTAVFSGSGSVIRAQRVACGVNCDFRSKSNGGRFGGCYVNYLSDKEKKAFDAYQSGDTVKISPSVFGRFTVWGDTGRLSYKGQAFLSELCDYTKSHTAYISDFLQAPLFRERALASSQTESHVKSALATGWRVYAGTVEARNALLECYEGHVFYCPIKGDGGDPYGCKQCGKCDGSRHVVAHSVGRP